MNSNFTSGHFAQNTSKARRNGSLFDVFLATVKENNEENEMSSKFAFSRLKMGEVESRVNLETEGREGLPLLETPPFLTAKMQIFANFILFICFF